MTFDELAKIIAEQSGVVAKFHFPTKLDIRLLSRDSKKDARAKKGMVVVSLEVLMPSENGRIPDSCFGGFSVMHLEDKVKKADAAKTPDGVLPAPAKGVA
jgi:hypothetical protein